MTEDTGRILWTNESKHYLLRLVRENPVIISPNVSAETMVKKDQAWLNIEQCFASDGMVCQLGKIKRLWKRMKDNARQNTMKANEQRKRGIKHVRPASDLDWQVHQLLATRNDMFGNQKGNKKKKPHQSGGDDAGGGSAPFSERLLPRMPPNITITSSTGSRQPSTAACNGGSGGGSSAGGGARRMQWTTMQHPLQHSLGDSDDGDTGGMMMQDDCGEDGIEDDDDCVDLVDLLTPAQQHQQHPHNGLNRTRGLQQQQQPNDALEPVTIIRELKVAEQPQDLTLDDDDDDDDDEANANDEYAFHPRHTTHGNGDGSAAGGRSGIDLHSFLDNTDDSAAATADSDAHRALQRELLTHDIQLRQAQRRHEDERMANERQLFRKRSQLLDLQIRRANLEMKRVQHEQEELEQREHRKLLEQRQQHEQQQRDEKVAEDVANLVHVVKEEEEEEDEDVVVEMDAAASGDTAVDK